MTKEQHDLLLKIINYNEVARMALENLNISDTEPVITVLRDNLINLNELEDSIGKEEAA